MGSQPKKHWVQPTRLFAATARLAVHFNFHDMNEEPHEAPLADLRSVKTAAALQGAIFGLTIALDALDDLEEDLAEPSPLTGRRVLHLLHDAAEKERELRQRLGQVRSLLERAHRLERSRH
jgi:hypothetical protein